MLLRWIVSKHIAIWKSATSDFFFTVLGGKYLYGSSFKFYSRSLWYFNQVYAYIDLLYRYVIK